MPAMSVQGKTLSDLLAYLGTGKDPLSEKAAASEEQAGSSAKASGPQVQQTQYTMTGYRRFVDPDGYPATATPWGTLNALDLATGEYLWQIPLGQYPELVAAGQPDTGSENYGGPIVTAGGLVFIAATNFDHKIRAFDKTTGKLLWEATLPFAGNATPATYEVEGRQYLVIAAGGSSMNPQRANRRRLCRLCSSQVISPSSAARPASFEDRSGPKQVLFLGHQQKNFLPGAVFMRTAFVAK